MEALPTAKEADVSLPQDGLKTLRDLYLNEGDDPRPQTKFNYAWALIRSKSKSDQKQGVSLLLEIYKAFPNRRRECLYYLALGEYKLGNYRNARKFNETLLQLESRNVQALELRKLIDDRVRSGTS
ncbi:hypothetical protein BDK51DRAFT_17691 [Blyttiomyces helicus]|uniref:Mitochondrial fission 1 protein n=1 Tax=Blyttiomyces helicus TaxID=388810 RepID=A0A4P9W147_9FUNG|nr:hypothetical protein BDK51DRAFT_17691 [Blyttiomyces helicus]|eukprot:RKO84290.1 hypothetical protein BDK51DRAFT_17691 [Blyttiomyces helicus]